MNIIRPILLSLLLAISGNAADPSPTAAKPPCCRAIDAGGPHTDRSIYQLESKWTSDVGKSIRLGALKGRIQITAMFFASCEFACPVTVAEMKAVQGALPPDLRDRVEFLLISFDTERDTPEALRAYRERQKLGVQQWTLLRGEADDVRELAALLGINFRKDARGQFAHTNMITVLNENGEIIHQQTGLGHDPAGLIRVLQSLAQTVPASPGGTNNAPAPTGPKQ